MKLKNIFFYICFLGIAMSGLSSCSGKDAKYTEETEETTAEIEAAMMQGRNTARHFINKEWKDTLELINHLLDAKSVQSEYVIKNKPRSAEAFDTAFIQTVRAVNPELALTITAKYPSSPKNEKK